MEDVKIREYLKNKLKDAAVSHIEIERAANRVNVTIHTAKPVWLSVKVDPKLKTSVMQLAKIANGKKVHINIAEIKNPDLDAFLVAESIAQQLERRVSFRRAMKQAIQRTMRSGAKGIKTAVSGRLGGAEIARRKVIAKEQFRFIHFVLISIMAQLKHIQLMAVSA